MIYIGICIILEEVKYIIVRLCFILRVEMSHPSLVPLCFSVEIAEDLLPLFEPLLLSIFLLKYIQVSLMDQRGFSYIFRTINALFIFCYFKLDRNFSYFWVKETLNALDLQNLNAIVFLIWYFV